MTESFTRTLRQQYEQTWSRATRHRFVRELADGSIPDPVMAGYLVQDHRFLDSFLVLLGAGIAVAETFDARIRLARFTGEVSGEENTYFLRAFDALGVSPDARAGIPDTPATTGFTRLFREAADTREYAAVLAVLVVSEWLYLEWASAAPKPHPPNFVHAEWITLHDNPAFRDLVGFLRSELDRVGPGCRALSADFFRRGVELELAFFEEAYAHPVALDPQPGSGGA